MRAFLPILASTLTLLVCFSALSGEYYFLGNCVIIVIVDSYLSVE